MSTQPVQFETPVHLMQIPDPKEGHFDISWNPDNPESVAFAKKEFKRAQKKGFMAYRQLKKDEDKGALIGKFDPKAERIRFIPAVIGG